MKLRKFTGPDARTVMKQVRRELGDDAVILDTKDVIQGGIKGFFGKPAIEIVAAAGSVPELETPAEVPEPGQRNGGVDLKVPFELPAAKAGPGGAGEKEAPPPGKNPETRAASPAPAPPAPERPAKPFVPLHLSLEQKSPEGGLPRNVVFIGPAGAGKTSAAGRLAWQHAGPGGRVRVVSLEENGRLSGVARWREFWEMLGAEFRVAFDPSELAGLGVVNEGAVLVDTPPLPLTGEYGWVEDLLEALPGFEVCLVADAHMSPAELRLLLERCEGYGPTMLFLTKADELMSPGSLKEAMAACEGRRVYVTDSSTITSPPVPVNGPAAAARMLELSGVKR